MNSEVERQLEDSTFILSQESLDDKSAADDSDKEDDTDAIRKRTRNLLARLEDFRQSYNRTHGQVCEFFEKARVVQKLGLLDPTQSAQLSAMSDDEAEDEEGNSLADGNYADGQKTTGMKRKLRKWRKTMRSALVEICPDLGLETQPDINPGLMKHILDEVRHLKSQVAFQQNSIVQLAQKTEMYKLDSEQKEQFIADLLQNCKGIRLDSTVGGTGGDKELNSADENKDSQPLPSTVADLQFGCSKEIISKLNLDSTGLSARNSDCLVVDPVDFASARKQFELTAEAGRGAPSSSSNLKGGEPAFIALQQRSAPRIEAQRSVDTLVPIGGSSNTCSASNPNAQPSTNLAVSGTKKRHFLMNLGGSLTIAVLGGLAINGMQKREHP